METRSQWGTRAGFILAALGSAVGLGNIWRFPAEAYANGGGAFFVPYLFALLTAGIPILIMEFTMGHKYRGSSPLSFRRMNKRTEWVGWWGVLVAFVISTYYSVIIAWAISYAGFSLQLSWGADPETFLFKQHLHVVENAGQIGNLVPGVLFPLIIVWIVVLGILYKGVRKGIEVANRIFIPTLTIMFLIIVLRAVTLPGALQGLDAFFKPDFSQILEPSVWIAAYGQIFFSMSIAFAIMITYASYLPKRSDLANNAFIVGFGNSSFELLAGIGVFSVLGFMALQSGVAVDDVVDAGVGLAFVVFPQIINELPALNGTFGFLFFASLVLAGLTSLMSITETYVAGLVDKFNISRGTAVLVGGGLAAVISLIYATQGGMMFLDLVDHFINSFGVAMLGLVEVILIVWVFRKLGEFKEYTNHLSDIQVGLWWTISLGVITPVVLGYMMYGLFKENILSNYGGYPDDFILYGWMVALAALVVGIVLSFMKWNAPKSTSHVNKEAK